MSASGVGLGFARSMPAKAKPEASNARIAMVTALAETVSKAITIGARSSPVGTAARDSPSVCVSLVATWPGESDRVVSLPVGEVVGGAVPAEVDVAVEVVGDPEPAVVDVPAVVVVGVPSMAVVVGSPPMVVVGVPGTVVVVGNPGTVVVGVPGKVEVVDDPGLVVVGVPGSVVVTTVVVVVVVGGTMSAVISMVSKWR
jgi:hypothetical protein